MIKLRKIAEVNKTLEKIRSGRQYSADKEFWNKMVAEAKNNVTKLETIKKDEQIKLAILKKERSELFNNEGKGRIKDLNEEIKRIIDMSKI